MASSIDPMRWFAFKEEGAVLPWKEWRTAVADPEDLMAFVALGQRAYRGLMKSAGLETDSRAAGTFTAFAHILHHTLDEMDENSWMELRFYLQESWREEEPGLWDPPDHVIWPSEGDMGKDLLALRHGLERAVAPDLLRLSWCMMTSSGRRAPVRRAERDGLFFPLMMLDKARAEDIPPFLDEEERAEENSRWPTPAA